MSEIYIGLMSGTSVDAMDAVAVSFSGSKVSMIASHSRKHSTQLKEDIQRLCQPGPNEIELTGRVVPGIALLSASTVKELLNKANLSPAQVAAIGSHGQTVRHRPEIGFTLQLDDPSLLAELTGIPVVADFRRRDMAAGGQGAPLVPTFHHGVFTSPTEHRVVVNIGGISNISILPPENSQSPVAGFDTGPGNLLMDAWCQQHLHQPYDKGGQWAGSEPHDAALLKSLLSDPYFHRPPPKSTGRELFNPDWLKQRLKGFEKLSTGRVQATLCCLTAQCIANGIQQYAPDTREVFACGGGANNLT
ncbi:MAG: anhydro-N-acetylmuramic acid kinase, partial [Endozoicomonas sp.]